VTPRALRTALRRLHLSQMELSRRLRIAPRTARSWALGQTRIPFAIDLLLECWRTHPQPSARSERRQKPQRRRP